MKNVMLTINGFQECDGEKNEQSFTGVAEYSENNGEIKLVYDDSADMGLNGVKSVLTVSPDGMVIMQRGGGSYGNIVVESGKRHICQYNTQYGCITIGISGDSVKNNLCDGVGTIELRYSIDVESRLLSRNRVEVIIEEDV